MHCCIQLPVFACRQECHDWADCGSMLMLAFPMVMCGTSRLTQASSRPTWCWHMLAVLHVLFRSDSLYEFVTQQSLALVSLCCFSSTCVCRPFVFDPLSQLKYRPASLVSFMDTSPLLYVISAYFQSIPAAKIQQRLPVMWLASTHVHLNQT